MMKENEVDAQQINLINYLEVIVNRKWMIFRITTAAFITAVVITLLMTKIYSSTAKFLPPQQDQGFMGMLVEQGNGSMASLAGDILGKGTLAEMYVSILGTETIRDTIIARFHLMVVYGQKYRSDIYRLLDKKVEITAGKKDGIISITVFDKDPQRAANIANAYVEELGKLTVGLNVSVASRNRSFYEKRLVEAQAELALAEEALMGFQSKNKALDLTNQAKASIEGVAQLRGQLALQEVQLDTIRRYFTEASQDVKTLRTTIANIKLQIAKLEGNSKGGSIPSIGAVPSLSQEYFRLMRSFKIQETIVERLTKQYEISKLGETRTDSPLQIIQNASVPDKRVKPKRAIMVLATTVAAFVFSVLLAFILDHLSKMSSQEKDSLRALLSHFKPY